ncbi:hypothetical protein ACTXT7_005964 [Hymenolepis weldensis]
MVGQNVDEAAFRYHLDLICSKQKFIDPEAISITSATTSTIINRLCRNATRIASARFEDFCSGRRFKLVSKSGCSTVSSDPKTDPTKIYLDICDHPPPLNPKLRRFSPIIGSIITKNASEDLGKESRQIRR